MQKKRASRPPCAAAFVTSFGLELELALLRQGDPFSIAMPVQVVNQVHDVSHTCWVAFRVPQSSGGPDLDALLKPDEDRWSLLGPALLDTGPLVVRLSGCPLIALPDLRENRGLRAVLVDLLEEALVLDAGGGPKARGGVEENLVVQPALLIDEHDAFLHTKLDLTSIPTGGLWGLEGPTRWYGLPPDLVSGRHRWSRFWMMLGVQTCDSAVRDRVTALVSSLPAGSSAGGSAGMRTRPLPTESMKVGLRGADAPSVEARWSGVAIDAHTGELEESRLFRAGIEVVAARAGEFVEDLDHYSRHLDLSADSPRQEHADFMVGGQCSV
jgi:hypothetical protein